MNKKQEQMKNRKNAIANRKRFGMYFRILVIVVFLLIFGFFFKKAIFKSANNVNLAQQTKNLYAQTNVLKSKRGTIYDNNNQALAEDTSTYSIYAILNKSQKTKDNKPDYVTNPQKTAKVLSENLPISYKEALKTLQPKKKAFQVEFGNPGKNISLVDKQKIVAQHLPGIKFVQQQSRLYPNGVFASHIVGLASQVTNNKTKETNLVGQMGLEKSFNKTLSGQNGYKEVRHDNYGYEVPGDNQKEKPAINGNNVHTTIDSRLEYLLENQMTEVQSQVHPKSMNAMLIDAKTGKVLAAAQRPTFNATTGKGLGGIWRNTLTQDAFEPGSTMKVFTLAASIDSGNFHGNERYLSGKYNIDGKTVPDWLPTGWGRITYNKGFALSSNVAMAHLEEQMGPKTWKEYINRFQFLKNTNSVFGDDDSGSMQFKLPIEQANTAFGQGIQVTALQMVQALTAVANNGKMIKPRFVDNITNDHHKVVKSYKEETLGHPIKASTSQEVRKHMEDVVYKPYGIGHDYQIPGYRVAAKTGTAQVSNGTGGYENGDDSYLYSVAGMVPSSNPRYIMYASMKQPTLNGSKTASQLMAQIFNPVMKRALTQNNENNTQVPDVVNQKTGQAKDQLNKSHMTPIVIGDGDTITKQSPTAIGAGAGNNHIILLTSGVLRMPDIKGWSQKDVQTLSDLLDIKLSTTGKGNVVNQSINRGQRITPKTTLVIKLK
ncbi:penicillin-binding protein 2B [Fructilactobacillus fructivorans]|uniref:penicillin-binding transpeptidase domain-containing protein n=1 Tax=Fructilactobacillus fructivorans TaxID=1614 RepID=UPI000705036F|nr:penicillin-binding transpeptidase domain-containing protein [Fructilactobacillus fructivorans]KRN13738.1 penicillin-binding protein 2B [Fructilactobacillus fructivorans]